MPKFDNAKKLARGLSIIPCCDVALHGSDLTQLSAVADRLLRDEPGFLTSRQFGPLVMQGCQQSPSLIIGDQREIRLFAEVQASSLEYRMALLASTGDTVVVNRRAPAFERYLAEFLGLDGINFVDVGEHHAASPPVSVQCRTDNSLRSVIADLALRGNGVRLLSYLTTGNIWRLAAQLAEEYQIPIEVCGPSPRISSRVNDKIWFINRVQEIIGPHAAPPTFAAYGPAAAAAHVARLSKQSRRVVLKIPNSAGSAGNIAFESKRVAGLPLQKLRRIIVRLLRARGWKERYPILVGVWECDVVSSPSAQLWIPSPEQGPPILEGIFEQVVQGAEGMFVGAVPAVLSQSLKQRLVSEAVQLATLFQKLGYFGRCSMDAVIAKSPEHAPEHAPEQAPEQGQQLHWIECNGRWGGVSIPMTAAHRLLGGCAAGGMVIFQQEDLHLPRRSMREALTVLEDILFKVGSTTSGIVFVSPFDEERGEKINLMALGDSQEMAEQIATEAMRRLHTFVR